MKTALITGASGFIGGRLIEHLLTECGVEIRAASRSSREWPAGVCGYVAQPGDRAALARACEGADVVVNLASMSEQACASDPDAALRINAGGVLTLVSAAIEKGVPRYVEVSTAKVYGNNPTGLVTEETPCLPASHYAITHRAAEDYARRHPGAVVFRLANGFGAPLTRAAGWDVIVNGMCREAVIDRRITLKSSGSAWRNFVPMSDILGALRAAIDDLPPNAYNLGSRDSMPLKALAGRIAEACGRTLGFEPVVSTGPAVDGESSKPLDFSIQRLTRAGFKMSGSFDDELSRTLLAAQTFFGRNPKAKALDLSSTPERCA